MIQARELNRIRLLKVFDISHKRWQIWIRQTSAPQGEEKTKGLELESIIGHLEKKIAPRRLLVKEVVYGILTPFGPPVSA